MKAFVLLFIYICGCFCETLVSYSKNNGSNEANNVTLPGRIIYKIVNPPHNLFIGRCTKKYPILHQEHVYMNNDGESQVSANIRMNIEGSVNIVCVNIYDLDPDAQAYPSYSKGGVGHNFVEFSVTTSFGKGFKFYVQIFGHKLG